MVISNCYGAEETPGWMAATVGRAKAKSAYVLHDADKSGESGASKWVNAVGMVRDDKLCGIIRLPYEIADKNGRDFRDFSNATFQEASR